LQCDTILVIGALVSAEIYGITMPIVELDQAQYAQLSDGMRVKVDAASDHDIATISF